MNPLPRQKLRELVTRFGSGLAYDARRCEGLLRDYCGAYRREIAVLVSAAEERVPADLLAANSRLPHEILLAKLSQRLQDNIAMEEQAAHWAVNSWALALGVISDKEIGAIEIQPEPQPLPVALAATQPSQKTSPRASAITVSAVGKGDYLRITDALDAAPPNAQIQVLPGLYRESVVINKPVTLVAQGKSQEVIIVNHEAPCLLIRTIEATVRGITFRQEAKDEGQVFFAVEVLQGNLTIEDCDITSKALSCFGIHHALTEVQMRRCRVYSGADSGIYIFDAAKGTVEECEIFGNANVGVAVTDRAILALRRCAIHDGKHAGIVAWDGGQALIEECEIYGNAKAGVGSSEMGAITIRHSRIYEGGNSGIFVHDDGRGTIEACEIYGHAEPEIVITLGGDVTMRDCKIHESRHSGVFVGDQGKALIEGCEIYHHSEAGVSVQAGGRASLRRCQINQNGRTAVQAFDGADVEVIGCDLTRNRVAAWEVADGAFVEDRGNQI